MPGFEASFQGELFELSQKLFNQPQEWKDALGTAKSYALRGYFRADTIEGAHKVGACLLLSGFLPTEDFQAHAEAYRFGTEVPSPAHVDGMEPPFWLRLHEGKRRLHRHLRILNSCHTIRS